MPGSEVDGGVQTREADSGDAPQRIERQALPAAERARFYALSRDASWLAS